MLIVLAVFSSIEAWTLPRERIEWLRREFPQHTFLGVWDVEGLRAAIRDADVALTARLDAGMLASARRLKWVQSPAAGVGSMLTPELIASGVIVTSMRGVRAHAIAEHVLGVTIALARRLPIAFREQTAHRWATDVLESAGIRNLQGWGLERSQP